MEKIDINRLLEETKELSKMPSPKKNLMIDIDSLLDRHEYHVKGEYYMELLARDY